MGDWDGWFRTVTVACALVAAGWSCGGFEGSDGDADTDTDTDGDTDGDTDTGTPTDATLYCVEERHIDGCVCHLETGDPPENPLDACSNQTVDNAVCCADAGYPDTGWCTCYRWGCDRAEPTCSCRYAGRDELEFPDCGPDPGTCCASAAPFEFDCSCSESACMEHQRPAMAGCGSGDGRCGPDASRVDACM